MGMHWRGRVAIVKAHAILDKLMFKDTKVKTDAIETRAISPDVAAAVVTESIDGYTTPSGQAVPPGQVRLNYIMTKGPDGWKIAHTANIQINAEAAKNDPVNPAPK